MDVWGPIIREDWFELAIVACLCAYVPAAAWFGHAIIGDARDRYPLHFTGLKFVLVNAGVGRSAYGRYGIVLNMPVFGLRPFWRTLQAWPVLKLCWRVMVAAQVGVAGACALQWGWL